MNRLEKYMLLIADICKDGQTGKKKLQKLMYLIERKGVQLDLRYSIHFFGPYSSRLDHAIHILENEDCLEINTSEKTHRIIMKNQESRHLSKEDDALVDKGSKRRCDQTGEGDKGKEIFCSRLGKGI